MTNTCKTCKHWDNWNGTGRAGVCCHLETGGIDDEVCLPAPNQLLARGMDDDTLILTGPDFGCIHWEEKP